MDKRKETILNTIIKEYLKTGAPVGSGVLVEKYKLDISPATARSEMAILEDEGYIKQPHTSAGRVPTEKAYKLYVDNLKKIRLGKAEENNLAEVLRNRNETSFKEAAKLISIISGSAVFWAFHRHNLYYTGISNLFQQPEFSQIEKIYDISAVIDSLDEIIDNIFENIDFEAKALIGQENPFGDFCGTVISKYRFSDNVGLFGIIGPMRMDYEKNLAIVRFLIEELSKAEND